MSHNEKTRDLVQCNETSCYAANIYGIDISKIYKCGLCETSFSDAKGLTRHIDSVHLKKKFRCNICSKEFNRKDNIMAHTKKFHEGRNIFQAIANDEKKEEDPPQQVIRGLY